MRIAIGAKKSRITVVQRNPLLLDATCCGVSSVDVHFREAPEPRHLLVIAKCPVCHGLFGTKVRLSRREAGQK